MNDLLDTIRRNKKPLLIILGVIAVVVWFLGSSFLNLVHNKMEFNRLTKVSEQLDQKYEELKAEQKLLQEQDLKHMERLARVKYHMSAAGETEFRFKNK